MVNFSTRRTYHLEFAPFSYLRCENLLFVRLSYVEAGKNVIKMQ
jgi:hypothetical protein